MRGVAWPSGAYHQHQFSGDDAPGRAVYTISGVLHVQDSVFGRKWVYKLNETRKQEDLKLNRRCGCRHLLGIISVAAVLLLVACGVGFTVFGHKYLDSLNKSYDNKLKNWSYHSGLPNTQNKMKIIFNIPKINQESNLTESLKINNNEKTLEHNKIKEHYEFNHCSRCGTNEICLQNTTKQFPDCVPVNDPNDPTGCAGLCKLEVESCQLLDSELKIYSCVDVNKLLCDEKQWKCDRTLMCLSLDKKCDGVIHCHDQSDELNCDCDLRTNFRCTGNISCIPNSKKCDGAVDCWDAVDETNCTHDCGPNNIPCYNGQCIPKEKYCDGIFHCSDKSDEPQGCTSPKVEMKQKSS